MTMIEQLKEELKNLTSEEKKELTALMNSEEQKEPETRLIGVMAPSRQGPRGEDITEEQFYDMKHPLVLHAKGTYDLIQVNGKTKRYYPTDAEVDERNRPIIEEWISAKRKYAAAHGLTFSDDYNPPVDPRDRNNHSNLERPQQNGTEALQWPEW